MALGIIIIIFGIIMLLLGEWYGILIILVGTTCFPNNNTNSNKKTKKTIKKTIIVSSSSRKKSTSAVGRGLVGATLLGPVGLLAGVGAKTQDSTTFQVIYTDGTQDTITVKNNSYEFKEYCKYLDN